MIAALILVLLLVFIVLPALQKSGAEHMRRDLEQWLTRDLKDFEAKKPSLDHPLKQVGWYVGIAIAMFTVGALICLFFTKP